MLQCYNRGCAQLFDPEQNTNESCRYHPGEPFFHDAYKGWSCCNKKSVDFTEFLSIKGCTLSKHSNLKPPEPEKPSKNENVKDEVVVVRAPVQQPMGRPPVDTPMTTIKATVASTLIKAIDSIKISGKSNEMHLDNGVVAVGTACKNKGCNYAYTNTSSDHGECTYHPGVPIFHEGMKFWSCCQKKTTDFAVFMAQKGCTYGEHKWFKENNKCEVQCRYDWHQTGSNVIVSIYAKQYHYSLSRIQVNPVRLHVLLVFPEQENAKFELDLELRGLINVNKVSAHMYVTKVEITLPKEEAGSWPKLCFPHNKLPPPKIENHYANAKVRKDSDSDDGFNLDDIDTVKPSSGQVTEAKDLE